jgi:cellulose synthase/poly-beta-1,6-N-acetylglucosamine synthase-like glycosyltransferase
MLDEYTQRLRWSRGSVLAFSTQVRGFKPGRIHWIFRAKKNQHAFLRRGSKAVGPMS